MRSRPFNSKKGFIGDVMTIIIYAFILGMTILVGWLVLSGFNSGVQNNPSFGAAGQNIIASYNNKYVSLWDGLFGVIFIGMSLAAAISAYFIDTHPIVFVLCVIMLAVFIIAGSAMSNVWAQMASENSVSAVSAAFQLMNYILKHLGYYALIEGALIMIALFTKARQ